MLSWMAWTMPSALFFIGIASLLLVMTVWEIRKPCVERKGWLPISTTRGDRLFIGLLSSAFVHLLFLGLTDLALWVAFGISVLLMAALLRWG
ncbi:MAG: putative small integral membrane protein [Flavobacteriales bacterium]|jgi:predicted small integral membrane protein